MFNVILFTDVTDNIVSIPAIGAYKCAHVLRKNNFSCLVVNHLNDWTITELRALLDIAIDNSTLLVGFSNSFYRKVVKSENNSGPTIMEDINTDSVFPQGFDFENEVISFIRCKNKNIKTVVGGNKAHSMISNKNIDYVCIGYSEISIVNLANHLHSGQPLNNSTKNIFGRIIIDDRFAKSYHFSSEDMEWLDIDVVNHKCLPIEIGRGCIFKCKFCSYPMNGKQALDFVKQPELLYKELSDNFEKFGISNYMIVDDTFNDHEEKLNSILSVTKRLKFQPKFWGYHRLDLLCTRPDTVHTLYELGIRSMYFGIETLNLETGRIIGKGFDRAKQISRIEYLKNTYPDLSLHGSFIVGLPKESISQVTNTYNQLMNQTIPLDSWFVQYMKIFKPSMNSYPSEISLDYEKYGYLDAGTEKNSNLINWKNEYMDYQTAKMISMDFMRESQISSVMKLPGNLAIQLTTLGYDLLSATKILNKDFDFNKVEMSIRPSFVKEYKQTLLKLLSIDSN